MYISPSLPIFPTQKCGTLALANPKLTILTNPSPRINPLANTIIGVSSLLLHLIHHHAIKPPTVLANVKLGVLYIPTATAMPPGT